MRAGRTIYSRGKSKKNNMEGTPMMRASKSQVSTIGRLKGQVGEEVDYTEIRALYAPAASREIDRLIETVASAGDRI